MLWTGEVLGKNREGLDLWRNVSEHCLVQTAPCGTLAETLGLPQQNRRNLELVAMAHNWDKKIPIYWIETNQPTNQLWRIE